VILWDAGTGRQTNAVMSYPHSVTSIAIRPDGRLLAITNRNGRIQLYDVGRNRPLFEQRFTMPLTTAVFSQDDRYLLTAGGRANGGWGQLWEIATGRPFGPSVRHDVAVVAGAFATDEKSAVVGCRDGAVGSWPTAADGKVSWRQHDITEKFEARVDAAATTVDPTGRTLMLFARKGDTRRWEAASGRPAATVPTLDKNVTAVAIGPNGHQVLVSDANKTIRLCDAATGRSDRPPLTLEAIPWHVLFSPDGTRFLTVSGDGSADWGKVQVWDTRTFSPVGPALPPRVTVTAVAFDPKGRIVATGGRDGEVRLWDVQTGRTLGPSLDQAGVIRVVAFDRSGKRLAVSGNDGSVRVWPVPEPATGAPVEVRRWVERITSHASDATDGENGNAAR
jgi:WD40 repeat protein